jgi:predicted transposase YbfD/YdcC
MNVTVALSWPKKRSRAGENEITASAAFLHPLLVKGRILSTDAMHTQKKWCAGVDAYQG